MLNLSLHLLDQLGISAGQFQEAPVDTDPLQQLVDVPIVNML